MRNTLVLSPDKFEEDLCNLKMNFLFNKTAEYLSIPSMIEVYWDQVEENLLGCWELDGIRILPSQDEYLNRYIEDNQEIFNKYTEDIIGGIKARVLKTYPSLVREHHFISLITNYLSELNHDYAVLSSTQIDMEKGVDLIIILDGTPYSLSITKKDSYTDWDKIKEQRKEGITNPSPIKVVVNDDNIKAIGKGKNQLWIFKDEIAENLIHRCLQLN